jgi:hypothetical protein
MMEPRNTGGCQCGAVRYRISGALGRASICHCRMCQKAFGAFYAPLVSAPLAAFELTRGSLGIFKSSDAVERGFCRDCGTPLTFRFLDTDQIDVAIGSLDDPSAAKPVLQVGIESRLPWLDSLNDLPGHATGDGGNRELQELIRATNHQHPDHDTPRWPDGGGQP